MEEYIFKRYEIKYLISKEQQAQIKNRMWEHMVADVHGKSTICNIYFDTPDYRMIRHSLEKPVYKEKLRLRSYGVAKEDTPVFIELKKKYQDVVYKRRIELSEQDALLYFREGKKTVDSQIARELDYVIRFYGSLRPSVVLTYDREAFYAADDHNFRVTFDENILWRDYDLSLKTGVYGTPILEKDMVLMEIKTAAAIPLWMTRILSQNHIYKTSFSKYGHAYEMIYKRKQPGGDNDVRNVI